jgi:hypothetical protein
MNKDYLIQKLSQIQDVIAECLIDLGEEREEVISGADNGLKENNVTDVVKVDFSKPVRPFVREYTKGKSGPKKFTILVAYFTKGNVSLSVSLNEIETQWSKMKSLLGGDFNRFYSAQAKDRDWVDSPKQGLYILRPNWKDALN